MDYRLEPQVEEESGFSDSHKESCGYWWDDELQDWVNEDLESWSDALEWECIADGCYV
jgi:hypothetical protein